MSPHTETAPPYNDGLQMLEIVSRTSEDFVLSIPSLSVARGSSLAIVGHNGAGKTTLVEALLGLRHYDGLICLNGIDLRNLLRHADARRGLGIQFQSSSFGPEHRVREILRLHASLYKHTAPDLALELGLTRLARRKLSDLSGGERQRLDVYFALAHDPALVILDEPMAGLDGHMSALIRRRISSRRGTTLIVTHLAGDLEVCDHLLWLQQGSVRKCDSPQKILHEMLGSVHGNILVKDAAAHDELLRDVKRRAGVSRAGIDGQSLSLFGDERVGPLVVELAGQLNAESFSVQKSGYDDLLRLMTREHAQ